MLLELLLICNFFAATLNSSESKIEDLFASHTQHTHHAKMRNHYLRGVLAFFRFFSCHSFFFHFSFVNQRKKYHPFEFDLDCYLWADIPLPCHYHQIDYFPESNRK